MASRKDKISYVLQISNGFIPVIVIPLLTRSTGLNFMGDYFILLSIIGAVQSIVDYGFNLSGIRSLMHLKSKPSDRMQKISLIVSVTLAKMILGVGLLILICIFGRREVETNDGLALVGVTLGIILSISNPTWVLFAIGESIVHAALVLFSRAICILPLLSWDITLVLAIAVTVLPMIVSNIASIVFLAVRRRLLIEKKGLHIEIALQFREGWSIFTNSAIVTLVTLLWPLILSSYISNLEVGIYGIADKIMRGMMTIVSPFQNFLIASTSNKKISEIIHEEPRKFLCVCLIIIAIPIAFIALPNHQLMFLLGKSIIEGRHVLNMYAIGFVFGAVHLVVYAEMVRQRVEQVYKYLYIITLALTAGLVAIFDMPIYAPLIVEIMATTAAFYWLLKTGRRVIS